jgi:adenylate kinase
MNLVLFGAPGAGKGTQATLLLERLAFVQISTGDILRSSIKAKTELGLKAQQFMDRGDLVPDQVVIEMVENRLKTLDGAHFILDGFPRTLAQAEQLDQMLVRIGLSIGKVIYLEVPKQRLVSRLSGRRVCKSCNAVFHVLTKRPQIENVCDVCGGELVTRADDAESVIGQRLENYNKQTAPLMDFYSKQGKLITVNGDRESEMVFTDLKAFLN